MCGWFQILCVFLATVSVGLALNRQVRINQPNTIEASPQDVLQEPEVAGNASYEFAYDVNDPLSNDVKSHREIRDGENVYGYYTFKEADGSTRVVNYKVGPKTGFEATVERLEIGERPEIKRPLETNTQAPQEARDNNIRVDQQRGRSRGRTPVRGGTISPQRNTFQEPQRINTFNKPPVVPVNQNVQATAPEYEFYTYIQDEKPLPVSAVDKIRGRQVVTSPTNPPIPNIQPDQDWKNSVIGRKHIREQIAMLAKKKEEEEAKKAALEAEKEQARQQQTTYPPTTEPAQRQESSTPSEEKEENNSSREEPPEEKEREREEEEEKGRDEEEEEFDEDPFHYGEEEDEE